jgi:hypothetical protein
MPIILAFMQETARQISGNPNGPFQKYALVAGCTLVKTGSIFAEQATY